MRTRDQSQRASDEHIVHSMSLMPRFESFWLRKKDDARVMFRGNRTLGGRFIRVPSVGYNLCCQGSIG